MTSEHSVNATKLGIYLCTPGIMLIQSVLYVSVDRKGAELSVTNTHSLTQ